MMMIDSCNFTLVSEFPGLKSEEIYNSIVHGYYQFLFFFFLPADS